MPKISLWDDGRHSDDYKFIDQLVSEQFTYGGTSMYIHKLLGIIDQGETNDATQPSTSNSGILGIQDLLFLENRDRKYEEDVYELRGHYNSVDKEFSNEQWGYMLQSDILYITFHINDMVERIGRKITTGDVLEIPHLVDFWALDDDLPAALKKFYVVDDAARAGEGYSPTWWPHLWRVKVKPMTDSQEYSDILGRLIEGTDDGSGNDQSLRDLLSVYNQELANNAAIIEQAEAETPLSGYDTNQFYILNTDEEGNPKEPEEYISTDGSTIKSPDTPDRNGWTDGYLTGDGLAPNGYPVTSGTSYPDNPSEGDYFLRTDYQPNRLFRYSETRWTKIEDVERTSLTPGKGQTQRDSFVNNTNKTITDDNKIIDERVALSDALKPLEDN